MSGKLTRGPDMFQTSKTLRTSKQTKERTKTCVLTFNLTAVATIVKVETLS